MLKLERAATALPAHGWQLLPLRFHRLDADLVVLTTWWVARFRDAG